MKRPSPFNFHVFKQEQITVKAILKKFTVKNPYENSYTDAYDLNPVYFKALLREVTPDTLTWQLYGLKERGAKELITEHKNLSLLQECDELFINDEEFKVYKDANSKRAKISVHGTYVVCILERI